MKTEELDNFPPLLRRYFTYLSVVKNRSELTVCEYASDLKLFIKYLVCASGKAKLKNYDEIDISSIDNSVINDLILNASDDDVYSFLAFLKRERNNSERSRSRKVSAIRSFYKWLYSREKAIDKNPMAELDSPKTKKSLPKYLNLDDSVNLLAHIEGKNRDRDYCIVTLFLNCGLRLSELVGINLSDINADNTLKVLGKGNKERLVYLNDACVSAIKNYLRVRPSEGLKDENALFISRNSNRISPKTVQHIIYDLLDKSGLGGKGYSVHKLRHTAATLMYQYGGVDIRLLKEILGHESISTTEIYTHINTAQLKNATDSNPLSKIGVIEETDD